MDQTMTTEKPFTGTLCVMDRTGDTKIMWDKNNPDDVEIAQSSFAKLRKKGYLIYKAEGKDGRKGEQINEFDATAERLIAVPPMVGG